MLRGWQRCPICAKAGQPTLAHVLCGECVAGATMEERSKLIRSLGRTVRVYPWSCVDTMLSPGMGNMGNGGRGGKRAR